LAAGAQVETFSKNPQQNQPLHAALALGKNAATIRLLLEHGAPANAAQAGGFTPLFSGAIANRKDLVEVLLAFGADAHRRSDAGKTAADFARERGHADMAAWLESLPPI
jgi:ankyrin repeat protein